MALIDPISRAPIPEKLFKYWSIDERALDSLENQELYLPSPIFNDPFDCNIPVQIDLLISNPKAFDKYGNETSEKYAQLPREMKELVRKEWESKEIQDEYVSFQQKKFKEDFGVLCLTSEPDNILMWSHYGNSHTGFCIGFDVNILVGLETFSTFGPVHYTNIYPSIAPQEYDLQGVYKQLFYKSIDWAYENEYRVVLRGGAGKKIAFPSEMIKEIYLGVSISSKNKEAVQEIRNRKFPSAELVQLEVSNSEFRLTKSNEN